MRRPTPLPPTSGAMPGAGQRTPPVSAGSAGSRRTREPRPGAAGVDTIDADATQPIAPLIALTAPTPTVAPDSGSVAPDSGAAVPTAAPGTPTPAEEPVGLREVWRAARARRKALRAEVRRFTVRQRRRRLAWLGAAASLVVLTLATLGAAYSPLFDVESITVEGASQLDASTVERALGSQLGKPLPLVDESAVKAALVTFPLVESYTLEARPPHELVVRIVERTPVGLIKTAAGYSLVDSAGVVLSTEPGVVSGVPVLTVPGGTDSPAFTAIGRVMRSLPSTIRVQVTAVSASTPDDVTLTLGRTRTKVVWGNADDSALKAVVLQATMKARPPAGVRTYDVSSPRAVVVS